MAWLETFYDVATVAIVFVGIYAAVMCTGMTIATLTVFLLAFYRLSPQLSALQASQSIVLSYIPGTKRVDEHIQQREAADAIESTLLGNARTQ